MLRYLRVGLTLALAATPSWAQQADEDEWIFAQQDRLSVAYIRYTSGLEVIARCERGAFNVMINGLPPARTRTRELRFAWGDSPVMASSWYVATPETAVVTTSPAPFARRLRAGGQMNIVVPGGAEGGRNLRYVVDLPVSTSAIDQALTACGRPLVDPRDALIEDVEENGLPRGFDWVRRPRAIYPEHPGYDWGFASLSCLTQSDGSLATCEVESEFPADGHFGAAALQATRAARVGIADQPGVALPVRKMSFLIRFGVEDTTDHASPRTGSHLRN